VYLQKTFPVVTVAPLFGEPNDCFISGDSLDCTFGNVIGTGSEWQSFDLEWRCTHPLPMSLVLYRALSLYIQIVDTTKLMALFSLPASASIAENILQIFHKITPPFRIGGTIFNYYIDFEDRFYSFVLDRKRIKPAFLELYLSLYHGRDSMNAQEQKQLLASLQKEFPGAAEFERVRMDFSHLFE
jgi:hypothetical protein